ADVKAIGLESPLPGDVSLPAIVSSSSLGRLWCLPPHTSSCRSGGGVSTGARSATLPSDGRSQPREDSEAKPCSSICAARTERIVPEEAPSTIAISRLPLRVAEATRL